MYIIKKSIAQFLCVLLLASVSKKTLRGEGPISITTEIGKPTPVRKVSIFWIHEPEINQLLAPAMLPGFFRAPAIPLMLKRKGYIQYATRVVLQICWRL